MATMQDVYTLARELATGNGRTAPRFKIALWAAVLSPRNDLENNGLQVDNLRPYLDGGLPTDVDSAADVAAVQTIIGGGDARKCTGVQAKAVMAIERMARDGELTALGHKPNGLAAWIVWRQTVAAFYGMSWKTASFAALLMWPFDAPFVPVDTHVCKRLGLMHLYPIISGKGRADYRRYRSIERKVYAERRAAGSSDPIALWHWYTWDMQRTTHGGNGELVSHLLLSPYYY